MVGSHPGMEEAQVTASSSVSVQNAVSFAIFQQFRDVLRAYTANVNVYALAAWQTTRTVAVRTCAGTTLTAASQPSGAGTVRIAHDARGVGQARRPRYVTALRQSCRSSTPPGRSRVAARGAGQLLTSCRGGPWDGWAGDARMSYDPGWGLMVAMTGDPFEGELTWTHNKYAGPPGCCCGCGER